MSDDFDFFTNDQKPKATPKAPTRPEPPSEPEECTFDEQDETETNQPSERRSAPPAEDRPSQSRYQRPREQDERKPDRGGPPAREAKKGMSPLLIGGIALGALIVAGSAVAVVLVARGKDPEKKDKPGTTAVVAQSTRPTPNVPAKKDVGDPNSPSPEVVEKVKKATVRILVAFKNGKGGSGSGFVEKESRLVVTNAHVVGMTDPADMGPRAIELIVNSGEEGKEYALGGELLAVDKENDLAVIRPFIIDVGERHIVPEGIVVPRTSTVAITQKLFVFGFPLGDALGSEISVRPTTVSALRKNRIQCEGGMTFGNSGGPVVDTKGYVVGIAVSIIRGEAIAFAIPGELAHQLLTKQRNK